jgi:hypothetical protein
MASCGVHFILRWAMAFVQSRSSPAILVASVLAGGLAVVCALKNAMGSNYRFSVGPAYIGTKLFIFFLLNICYLHCEACWA